MSTCCPTYPSMSGVSDISLRALTMFISPVWAAQQLTHSAKHTAERCSISENVCSHFIFPPVSGQSWPPAVILIPVGFSEHLFFYSVVSVCSVLPGFSVPLLLIAALNICSRPVAPPLSLAGLFYITSHKSWDTQARAFFFFTMSAELSSQAAAFDFDLGFLHVKCWQCCWWESDTLWLHLQVCSCNRSSNKDLRNDWKLLLENCSWQVVPEKPTRRFRIQIIQIKKATKIF